MVRFPDESVTSTGDLIGVTHHGVPAMGWIILGLAFIGIAILLLVKSVGIALKLYIPQYLIAIGSYIILYAFSPPLTAILTLFVGTGIVVGWGVYVIFRVIQGI